MSRYDGKDAFSFKSKFSNLSERAQDLIYEIKEKEERDMNQVRASMAKMSFKDDTHHEQSEKGRYCFILSN